MSVARLGLEMDMPEYVHWLAFYRYRAAKGERDREVAKAATKVAKQVRGSRGGR